MPAWVIVLLVLGGCGAFVLAGVAVLGAVTFPVFVQARDAARRTGCASNLKQMGLALQMYAQDYDQQLPPPDRWPQRLNAIQPGVSDQACPSATQGNGYAYNERLAGMSLARVASPRDAPVLFDSSNPAVGPVDAVASFAARHRGSAGSVGNVAYADGSVRAEVTAPAADAGVAR